MSIIQANHFLRIYKKNFGASVKLDLFHIFLEKEKKCKMGHILHF